MQSSHRSRRRSKRLLNWYAKLTIKTACVNRWAGSLLPATFAFHKFFLMANKFSLSLLFSIDDIVGLVVVSWMHVGITTVASDNLSSSLCNYWFCGISKNDLNINIRLFEWRCAEFYVDKTLINVMVINHDSDHHQQLTQMNLTIFFLCFIPSTLISFPAFSHSPLPMFCVSLYFIESATNGYLSPVEW